MRITSLIYSGIALQPFEAGGPVTDQVLFNSKYSNSRLPAVLRGNYEKKL